MLEEPTKTTDGNSMSSGGDMTQSADNAQIGNEEIGT